MGMWQSFHNNYYIGYCVLILCDNVMMSCHNRLLLMLQFQLLHTLSQHVQCLLHFVHLPHQCKGLLFYRRLQGYWHTIRIIEHHLTLILIIIIMTSKQLQIKCIGHLNSNNAYIMHDYRLRR